MSGDLRATATDRGAEAAARPAMLTRMNTRGLRLLHLADAVTVFAVLVGINLARFGLRWPTYPVSSYLAVFAAATGIHLVVYYFAGLYERDPRLGARALLPRVATPTVTAGLLYAALLLVTGQYPGGRATLPVLVVLASLAVAGNRLVARRLRLRREGLPRVLLVGAPDDANLAGTHLAEDGTAAVVAGHVATAEDLLGAVERLAATDVLLLSPRDLDEIYPEPLATLEARGVGVLQRVTARDTVLGLRGVSEIAGLPFVVLQAHTLPASRARFKRVLELVGLVATAPVTVSATLLVALYVRAVAGSPVLYWQERVGRDARVFRMAKFRTMQRDAELATGPVLAGRDDARVVPGCGWLRSTRLDELPQLYNVLRGEMSVVGPRPERPELTAQYGALIPGYGRRHEIPPGITGLAQVHGRYHTDPEYKLGHDLQYLVNWSPVLDLQILARTIWVVLARKV